MNQNPIEVKELEIRLVRTLIEGDTFCKDYLLNVPHESLEHFGSVWDTLTDYIKQGVRCPSFTEIHLSPLLPDRVRYDLQAASLMVEDYPVFAQIEDVKLVIEPMLNKYRRQVFIAHGLKYYQDIQDLDVHESFLPAAQDFLQSNTSMLAKWQKPRTRYGFGDGFKVDEVIDALDAEKTRIIPSGFHAFDTRSGGGYATGESVFMAAPSSQGKSLVAAQEGLNMALMGYKVKIVTLEMKASANVHRFLSNAGQIHVTRFRNKANWADQEKAAQKNAAQLLQDKIYARGGYLEIIQPEGGYTLADVAIDLVTNEPDVLIIDYINLMSSDNHNDLWKMIFEYARGFKLLAVQHDALIISLAQLDDEGRVKYARSIKEHCDVLKVWKREDDDDDDHEGQSFQWDTEISVEKGRNSGTFKYWVTINTAYMRAIDKESQTNHVLSETCKEINAAAGNHAPRKMKPAAPEPTPAFEPPKLPAQNAPVGEPPSPPTTPPPPSPPTTPPPPSPPPAAKEELKPKPESKPPSIPQPTTPPDFFGMSSL